MRSVGTSALCLYCNILLLNTLKALIVDDVKQTFVLDNDSHVKIEKERDKGNMYVFIAVMVIYLYKIFFIIILFTKNKKSLVGTYFNILATVYVIC